MRQLFRLRFLAVVSSLLLLLICVPHIAVITTFPQEIRVFDGEELSLNVGPLFALNMAGDTGDDSYEIQLLLLGRMPVKKAQVSIVSEMHVVPGGQAVGILTDAGGLHVLSTPPVLTAAGEHRSPAAEAGVRPGDVIIRVGDAAAHHPLDLESAAQWYGRRRQPVPVVVRRGNREIQLKLQPIPLASAGASNDRYMLGIYLKDPAAGVGTLTFWDPKSRVYGALGHQIAEGHDATMIDGGHIVSAQIHGIQPGSRGRPGEKMGIFEQGPAIGTIDKNTPFGIFGRMSVLPEAAVRPVPIALNQDIQLGRADILTVLEGNHVESFAVEIVAIHSQARPSSKGLVLRVTDPRLLARTRGIVQGMSGSPILQDGKLVGAVTHVFVNDPARGFGVLAEWMVYEAGLSAMTMGLRAVDDPVAM